MKFLTKRKFNCFIESRFKREVVSNLNSSKAADELYITYHECDSFCMYHCKN